jgi:histone H3/H4
MSQKKAAARRAGGVKSEATTEPVEHQAPAGKAVRADRNNLRIYLYRMLKKIQPEISVRSQTIELLNTLSLGLIHRIIDSSIKAARLHMPTVKSVPLKSVQAVVYSMIPLVLRDSIFSVAQSSLDQYKASQTEAKTDGKKKSRSKSDRAGLVLSVSRVDKIMRSIIKTIGFRASQLVSVYITAVVENLIRLALGPAIEVTKTLKRESVNEQALITAVETSPVLISLFIDWLIITKQQQEEKKAEKKLQKKEKRKVGESKPESKGESEAGEAKIE